MNSIKFLPPDFPEEYTFRHLNEWFAENNPTVYIGMSLRQEMWYRFLLRPEYQLPAIVTFRGLPIIVG